VPSATWASSVGQVRGHLIAFPAVGIARDALQLFRYRHFTFLMGAQWLNQAAQGLVVAAMAKTITFGGQQGFDAEAAKSPEEAFRIVLFTFLPYLLLSPLLGVLIDRWDRRKLLVVANLVPAVVLSVIVALGLSAAGDATLYISLLIVLASTRLVLAIKGAGLPAAAGEDNLIPGNSVSQAGSAIFQLAGAGAALIAADLFDTRLIVAGGVVVYALATASAVGARRLGYPREVVPILRELGRIIADLVQGIREVARRPRAGLALVSFLAIRSLATMTVLAISFSAADFIDQEGLIGTAVPAAAGALGAVVGFGAAGYLRRRVAPPAMVVLGLVVGGIGVAAFGGIITLAGLSIVAFAVGFGFFVGKIAVDTMMQESLADQYRGRGFGLQDVVYNLSWVLPSLLLVLLYDDSEVRSLLVVTGLAFAGIGLLLGVWARRLREPAAADRPAGASASPQ
jgi:MFS family permease